jgi:hypothetical protein
MGNQLTVSGSSVGASGSQKIEVPSDVFEKERLMKYHGVTTDKELKLAIYQDMLRKQRNKRSSSSQSI